MSVAESDDRVAESRVTFHKHRGGIGGYISLHREGDKSYWVGGRRKKMAEEHDSVRLNALLRVGMPDN